MSRLKEELQKDINLISNRIDRGYKNDEVIAQNIEFILVIAEDQDIKLKYPRTIKKYIKNYKEDVSCAPQEYIDNYHKYKDFNISLSKVGERINDEYGFKLVDPKYRTKIKMDDSIKLVGDFFKQYDQDIYDYYEDFVTNGKFFVVKKLLEHYGYSSVSDDLLDPYLFVKKSNSLQDMAVIAHEIIHIYLSEKHKHISNEEEKKKYVNGVNEVYSHYIEYLLLDYLKSIDYDKKDIKTHKRALYSDLIEHLDGLYLMLEPTDIDFTEYDEVVFYNDMKIYSYGLYFLYHFYDQYLLSKDMAKENITNFMLDSKDYEFDYLINHYGLSEDKLRNEKVILKHVKKIY